MLKRLICILLLLTAGFSLAYAEDDFAIDISPELQERIAFEETRIQAPPTNFGYRTVRFTIQTKTPGDRPVIWAKFYDADGTLLESIWDRVKVDVPQKCKFDYMDVQSQAVRMELSLGK